VSGARTRTQRKAEIIFDVGENKYFDHRADKVQVVWKFSISISRPQRLQRTRRKYSWRGKDMKERESVSMPRARKKPVVGKSVELPTNGIFLIEKPPAAAKLIFPATGAVLKISDALAKT